MVLTPLGRGNEGGWVGGGGDMHNWDTEHGTTIYFDADGSRVVIGGGSTARGMDIKATVGAGGYKIVWYTTGDGKGSRD